VVICPSYGMVELSAIATLKIAVPGVKWPRGCVGVPVYPIRARVVDENGNRLPNGEEGLLAWCRENIAPYKVPRRVHIVSLGDMLYGMTLKVLKRELRRRYLDDFEGEEAGIDTVWRPGLVRGSINPLFFISNSKESSLVLLKYVSEQHWWSCKREKHGEP